MTRMLALFAPSFVLAAVLSVNAMNAHSAQAAGTYGRSVFAIRLDQPDTGAQVYPEYAKTFEDGRLR